MLQEDVAQLADNVLALALYDDIEVAIVKGFLGQRTHLGAARRW